MIKFLPQTVPHILYTVKNFLFYEGINIGKLSMCKKEIFELIYFYEDNQFPQLFLLNNTQMLVYFNIKISLKTGKTVLNFFLTVHFLLF